jgi:small subunit ribosomal protein S2e
MDAPPPSTATATAATSTTGGGAGGAPRERRGGFGAKREGGNKKTSGQPRAQSKEGSSEEWVPCTKLGRLVKSGLVPSLEHVFLHTLPIKEYQIVDFFLGESLKDEVVRIMPVQKQTAAGQRTRFKCFVVVGDYNGHIGLGVKTASEVATAIRGAIWNAKTNIVPIRRGYWGLKAGSPHTVATKVTGAAGSVRVRIIPAPRGTGLVAAPTTKKILFMAGLQDAYTSTRGHSKTQGNFVKAAIAALASTYAYLTPDLWPERKLEPTPYEINAEYLAKTSKGKKGN